MSRGIRVFWLANLDLFLFAPYGLRAQDAPNGARFRLTSRLVYVDVVVRDRSGKIVQGRRRQVTDIELGTGFTNRYGCLTGVGLAFSGSTMPLPSNTL